MSQLIGELAYAIGDFRRDGHAHIFTAYNAVRQGAKNKPTPNPPITDVHSGLRNRLTYARAVLCACADGPKLLRIKALLRQLHLFRSYEREFIELH